MSNLLDPFRDLPVLRGAAFRLESLALTEPRYGGCNLRRTRSSTASSAFPEEPVDVDFGTTPTIMP